MNNCRTEVDEGKRFAFGRNWARFLAGLGEDAIRAAEASLVEMLQIPDLHGLRFLDIGSGSALFSLAARRLGARVHSFDYDPLSVACAQELQRRYFPGDPGWTNGQGSVLDSEYLKSLGLFDVVYSWGVLHHTGRMWQALDNAQSAVAPGGRLFVAIYNDQGIISVLWRKVKEIYCSGFWSRGAVLGLFFPYLMIRGFIADLLRLQNPFRRYSDRSQRGMSLFTDWLDWLGGLPFEVARPEEIFNFLRAKGFNLISLKTCGGSHGNNQFVFQRLARGARG